MKRIMTILTVIALFTMTAGTASAVGSSATFGWTISNSLVDPNVNTGASTGGVVSLGLWLQCGLGNGMASAEFDLGVSGAMSVLAFTAMNGFLNAGGSTNLLLAVGACPSGPVLAGTVLIFDNAGDICLVPAGNGNNVTVECGTLALIDNYYRGYSNVGAPCEHNGETVLCDFISVDDTSWGAVKSLYR